MLKIHRQTVASVIVKDLQTDSCISNTNRLVKQKQGNVGESLVVYNLLYGCGTWTLTPTKRCMLSRPKYLRKLLRISYLEHKTSNWVRSKINFLVHLQEHLLATVKRQKLMFIVQACQVQNLPSRWATPWSADKMLEGKRQRVDVPFHAVPAHDGLTQKRLKKDLCWFVSHVPLTTWSVKDSALCREDSNMRKMHEERKPCRGTWQDNMHNFRQTIMPSSR